MWWMIGLAVAILWSLPIFFGMRAAKNKKEQEGGIPAIWSIPGIITEVEKPWGKEVIWARTEKYVGKILHINAGHQLSKQYHKKKDESIYILSGVMILDLEYGDGRVSLPMISGDCIRIPTGVIHRMTATTDVQLAEVSTSELWDVVRLEDNYGRVKS